LEGDADQESFEATDRFSAAFAFGSLPFEVDACGFVDAGGLGDRDAVERRTKLAVAPGVET
jgi:hypothetical protein